MSMPQVRIEKRLNQRRWLMVAVPVGSFLVALVLIAILLVTTGHPPVSTFRRLLMPATSQTAR